MNLKFKYYSVLFISALLLIGISCDDDDDDGRGRFERRDSGDRGGRSGEYSGRPRKKGFLSSMMENFGGEGGDD